MLECMEEKQVSSDGTTYALPAPFFVIATQNPVETQGTFPLPEAQLDRFMVKLRMGYPTLEEQSAILRRFMQDKPQERLAPVAAAADVLAAQQAVTCVRVQDDLLRYIGEICEKTRALEDALLGASPRAALALMRVSQSYAAVCGRDYVTPEDVKRMAVPVLAHRLILRTAFGPVSYTHLDVYKRQASRTASRRFSASWVVGRTGEAQKAESWGSFACNSAVCERFMCSSSSRKGWRAKLRRNVDFARMDWRKRAGCPAKWRCV